MGSRFGRLPSATDAPQRLWRLILGFADVDRHFGDPDEKHTASLALDNLRQSNREFGAYYADFQELLDILETTDDTSRRHALK